MLNNFVVLGRIVRYEDDAVIIKQQAKETYEDWYITLKVGHNILTNMKAYCTIGDLVGIKGHIEHANTLVAEKVTFLSSKGGETNDSNAIQEGTETEGQG